MLCRLMIDARFFADYMRSILFKCEFEARHVENVRIVGVSIEGGKIDCRGERGVE